MNITPNTDLRILHNVPLDNSYEHTIYFGEQNNVQSTLNAQAQYFSSKTKYTFNELTYQRVYNNVLRIERNADDLYDCNYLMFRNTNFGSKWFYAFINKVTYINNACAEVEYELDVMQTWYTEYTVDESFVERMHTRSDIIGEHLVPETIVPTHYKTAFDDEFPKIDISGGAGNYHSRAILLCSDNGNLDPTNYPFVTITNVRGVPCQLLALVVDMSTNASEINRYIEGFNNNGHEKSIIGVYVIPPVIDNVSTPYYYSDQYQYDDLKTYQGTFDGYVPRNNKMYTYPYNLLQVSNSFGQMKEYRFEGFPTHNSLPRCLFNIEAVAIPKPNMIIKPTRYEGSNNHNDDILSIGEYPEGTYNGDSYQLWAHQGMYQDIASVASGGFRTLAGMALGDYVGAMIGVGSTFSAITNSLAHVTQAQNTPNQHYGNASASAAIYALEDGAGYAFHFKTRRPDYAQSKMIDDYFTKFGYAQNQLMPISMHNRTRWTYVKTIGCTITGTVPADDENKIESVYNSGITFWVNGSEIGNYSLSNAPLE